jgi:hypothetical protein
VEGQTYSTRQKTEVKQKCGLCKKKNKDFLKSMKSHIFLHMKKILRQLLWSKRQMNKKHCCVVYAGSEFSNKVNNKKFNFLKKKNLPIEVQCLPRIHKVLCSFSSTTQKSLQILFPIISKNLTNLQYLAEVTFLLENKILARHWWLRLTQEDCASKPVWKITKSYLENTQPQKGLEEWLKK